jgi:adenylyltransferase/sulfurtransferase
VDTLSMKFRTFNLRRDPECPVCGDHPTITAPIDYDGFCGIPKTMEASNDVPEVTVQELKTMMDGKEDFFLLDVREPVEWEIARLPGATLIPLGELPDRLDELPGDKKLVVHCKSGARSARAVGFLRNSGYEDAWNVAGGINAWSREIDPEVALY